MLDNVTNRYFVPAPRSMLDPVDAMWRTKIKWFRRVHITNKWCHKIGKSFDPHFRLMIPPDTTIVARPLSAARPANGKIGTRFRKSDRKATGALETAQD